MAEHDATTQVTTPYVTSAPNYVIAAAVHDVYAVNSLDGASALAPDKY